MTVLLRGQFGVLGEVGGGSGPGVEDLHAGVLLVVGHAFVVLGALEGAFLAVVVEDVVEEERGDLGAGLQIEFAVLALLVTPEGQRLLRVLGVQPPLQQHEVVLGEDVGGAAVEEADEGRDQDGEDEAAVELEVLLVGNLVEEEVEADVVEERGRAVEGLELVLLVLGDDLALDALGAQALQDDRVVRPRSHQQRQVLEPLLHRLALLHPPRPLHRRPALRHRAHIVVELRVRPAQHRQLLPVSVLALAHVVVREPPLHRLARLAPPRHPRRPVLEEGQLEALPQQAIDLLGALLARPHHYPQHVQPRQVAAAARRQPVRDGVAHQRDEASEDLLVEADGGVDGREDLGEQLARGRELVLVDGLALGAELEVAAEGVEEDDPAASIEQRADVDQRAGELGWALLRRLPQPREPAPCEHRAAADQAVVDAVVEVEEGRAAEAVLGGQHRLAAQQSLPQRRQVRAALAALGLELGVLEGPPPDEGALVYSGAQEEVGPGVAVHEERRARNIVADGRLGGLAVVADVVGALLLALGLDLLEEELVQRHRSALLAVRLPVLAELHRRSHALHQLAEPRVKLLQEGGLRDLVLEDAEEELQRPLQLVAVEQPVLAPHHELQPRHELLPLRPVPQSPEVRQVRLLRVQLVHHYPHLLHRRPPEPVQQRALALLRLRRLEALLGRARRAAGAERGVHAQGVDVLVRLELPHVQLLAAGAGDCRRHVRDRGLVGDFQGRTLGGGFPHVRLIHIFIRS